MRRRNLILAAFLLGFLASSCEIFPYLTVTQATPTEMIATSMVEPISTRVIPTATLISLFTPTITDFSETPSATPTAPLVVFSLQEGNPLYLPNFAHPDAGCAWLGVAGQVFDAKGIELLDLTLIAGDIQNDSEDPMIAKTGTGLAYGLGGYEIQLSDAPIATTERFWLQVIDPDGLPLTDRIFFKTFEDCSQNLVLINFISFDNSPMEKSDLMSMPTSEAYP